MTVIKLTKGDDSNALGRSINIKLKTDLDLTGYTAVFQLCDFQQKFDDITSKTLPIVIPASASNKYECGQCKGALKIYDKNGLGKTVCRDILFFIETEVVKNG